MTSAEDVIKCASSWAKSQTSTNILEYYLFGSAIYQGGMQFDYGKYRSDLDIVARLRPGLTSVECRDTVVEFREQKYALEVQLLPVLKVRQLETPIVSAIPVTATELAFDIHKTITDGFFSTNDFLNLRSGAKAKFAREYTAEGNGKFLLPAIQACQAYRNQFLSITANKLPAVPPHDNEDAIPKTLARASAAVAHYEKPRAGVNEHDINEGTTYLFSLVDNAESQHSGVWGTLRQILQRRMARGGVAIAPEDVLILYELLSEKATSLLTASDVKTKTPYLGLLADQLQTGLKFSGALIDGKSVKVDINISQKAVSASQIEEILAATREFFRALGFAQTCEDDPRFGSFFQELVFTTSAKTVEWIWKLIWKLLSERLGRSDAELQNKVFAPEMSEAMTSAEKAMVSHKQLEATTRLLEAVDDLDEVVIRLGGVVIVKSTVNDQRQLFVHQLSESEIQLLSDKPEAMKSPNEMLEFLQLGKTNGGAQSGITKP